MGSKNGLECLNDLRSRRGNEERGNSAVVQPKFRGKLNGYSIVRTLRGLEEKSLLEANVLEQPASEFQVCFAVGEIVGKSFEQRIEPLVIVLKKLG